jgi:DNA topoisomerase-1
VDWKKFLQGFWLHFNDNIGSVSKKTIPEILESLNQHISPYIFGVDEAGKAKHKCPSCDKGTLGIKIGGFGVFIGCSNYPDCKYTKSFSDDKDGEMVENADGTTERKVFEPILLGKGDNDGETIIIKKGPYGLYLELAKEVAELTEEEQKILDKKAKALAAKEKAAKAKAAKDKTGKTKAKAKKASKKDGKPKPKRVSIPRNVKVEDIDLVLAKKLLSLPREVGLHPETGLKIVASIGPFGPYLLHDGKYSSVKEDDVLEIGLNRAVDVIVEVQNRKLAKKTGFKKKRK